MKRSAELSDCGLYRWTLVRDWFDEPALFGKPEGECLFVGINPSYADGNIDDQTVKIWTSFCRRWGYGRFTAVNLCPLISTQPGALLTANIPNAIKAENERRVRMLSKAFGANNTVVCWGADQWIRETAIDQYFMKEVIEGRPMCFGFTKDGYPRHPLRLSLATQRVPYRLPNEQPTAVEPAVNLESMRFNGSDYEPKFDDQRLTGQILRIFQAMKDGHWRTLSEIEAMTKDPPASISAQLRHLRKERFGSHSVHKRPRGDRSSGLFEYQLVIKKTVIV